VAQNVKKNTHDSRIGLEHSQKREKEVVEFSWVFFRINSEEFFKDTFFMFSCC